MSPKRKQLNKGPFTAKQIERALTRGDGWFRVPGSNHIALKHPSKPGKVSLSENWDSVKRGQLVFKSIARQAGMSQDELVQLINHWG